MTDITTLFIAIILIGVVITVILTVVGTGHDSSLLYWPRVMASTVIHLR